MNNKHEVSTNKPFEITPDMQPEEIMIHVLQNQMNLKEKVNDHDKKIDYLENTQPVNPSVTSELERLRKKTVIKWLGGKNSPAYNHVEVSDTGTKSYFSRKVFAEAGRDFKGMFNIPRYDMLQKKDEKMALSYWENWEPSTNTKMRINALNNQMELLQR